MLRCLTAGMEFDASLRAAPERRRPFRRPASKVISLSEGGARFALQETSSCSLRGSKTHFVRRCGARRDNDIASGLARVLSPLVKDGAFATTEATVIAGPHEVSPKRQLPATPVAQIFVIFHVDHYR